MYAWLSLCLHCKRTHRLRRVPIVLITRLAYPNGYAKAQPAAQAIEKAENEAAQLANPGMGVSR